MPAIKIGTRNSQLAMWQARYIQRLLEDAGHESELVLIKSEGEIDLTSPLYEMGVQGIFTKTLDMALLQGSIDIAVHSLKDVPTQLANGLYLAATPNRGNHIDLLILKSKASLDFSQPMTIASSSLRRQAQWLNKYPHHNFEPIRGNINSRVQKLLVTDHWSAIILAAAGIERIGLEVPHVHQLEWMLPAPSQGALSVFCREDDKRIIAICAAFNDEDTNLCTSAERLYLRTLMGGCTMPIGAYAFISNNQIHFKGNLLTVDGQLKTEVELTLPKSEASSIGRIAAEKILEQGGQDIIQQFKQ